MVGAYPVFGLLKKCVSNAVVVWHPDMDVAAVRCGVRTARLMYKELYSHGALTYVFPIQKNFVWGNFSPFLFSVQKWKTYKWIFLH